MEKEVLFDSDLHFEHKQWESELAFWNGELKSFKNKLSELVNRWTDKEIMAHLEHFQNQIILHGEVIDTMKHDIRAHESNIASHSMNKESVQDVDMVKKHLAMRAKMETQRQIYTDLKKEFFAFLSKYM